MLTNMRLLLPLLLAMGSMTIGEGLCEFEVRMFSNATKNNCFSGWSLKQATNLALPFLMSWKEKVYPELITPSEECFGVKTLTIEEYNALDSDEKKEYQQSMEDWGWNTAYDLNFPYCKDQGYRAGFKKEYNDKLNSQDMVSGVVPIGAPTDELPQEPGPKPELVTTANYTKWYVEAYGKGWKKGCDEGFREGEKEGKAAGKTALQSGTEYSVAYMSAFKKGYNDALLGIGSPINRRLERNLRGAESNFREYYSNGYSQGYDEALTAQVKKRQGNRKLAGLVCPRYCYTNQNKYNYCMVLGLCEEDDRRRRLESDSDSSDEEDTRAWESRFAETLPLEGRSGGHDFKVLLGRVVSTRCKWEDVNFEVWERCPVPPV